MKRLSISALASVPLWSKAFPELRISFAEDSPLSSLEARKFLDEALRMREFDHQHILGLIGISLDQEDMPLVVLPFMKHGDLLSYLRCEDNVRVQIQIQLNCICN